MTEQEQYFFEKYPESSEVTDLREVLAGKGMVDVTSQNEFMARIDNAIIKVATEKGLLEE